MLTSVRPIVVLTAPTPTRAVLVRAHPLGATTKSARATRIGFGLVDRLHQIVKRLQIAAQGLTHPFPLDGVGSEVRPYPIEVCHQVVILLFHRALAVGNSPLRRSLSISRDSFSARA